MAYSLREPTFSPPPPLPPVFPVENQVLPAFAPRLAVTLWFYGRQLGLPRVPPALPVPAAARRLPSAPPAPQEQLEPGEDTRNRVRPLPTPDGSGAAHAAEVSGSGCPCRIGWLEG